MAVDVSKIPNNNKFDPVREAILQIEEDIASGVSGVGSLNGLTGLLTIAGTDPITVSPSGTTITIALANTISGDRTFSNNITISGNLTVNGTTTTINTEELTVEDKNITIAYGAATAAEADGAGITIDGADATLTYNSAGDDFTLNKSLIVDEDAADITIKDTTSNLGPALRFVGDGSTGDKYVVGFNSTNVGGYADELAFFNNAGDIVFYTDSAGVGAGVEALRIYANGDVDVAGNFSFGGALGLNVPDALSFENGKHWITYNDGGVYNDFNIRVGHYNNSSDVEECTEAGYIMHDEWIQSLGQRQFLVSDSNMSVGGLIGTDANWRLAMQYTPDAVIMYYQGNERLRTTNAGVQVTGSINFTGSITLANGASISSNAGAQLITTNSGETWTVRNGGGSDPILTLQDSLTNVLTTFDANGHLGIGTTTPDYHLDIEGAQRISNFSNARALILNSNRVLAEFNSNGAGTSDYGEIHIRNDVNASLRLGSIGSNYAGVEWANSSYIYDTEQDFLRIKASNQLELFSGGFDLNNKRVIVAPTGQVGIGTQPDLSSVLHVKDNDGAEIRIEDNTSTTFGTLRFVGDSSTFDKGLTAYNSANLFDANALHLYNTAGDIVFRSSTGGGSGTERMRITSSGNVGIGVVPSNWSLSTLSALQIENGGFYAYGQNEVGVVANAYYNGGWKYISSDSASMYFQDTNSNHVWRTAASGTAGNGITWSEKMRIDASGNVGIGTTSPSQKLDVNGSIRAGNANQSALLVAASGTATTQAAIAIQQVTTEGDTIIFADYEPYAEYGIIARNSLDSIDFTAGISANSIDNYNITNRSGNARTAYVKARISLNSGNAFFGGNVGIGTTSPIDKLHVAGGITSTSIASPSNTNIGSLQIGYDGSNGIIRTWNSSPLLFSIFNFYRFDVSGSAAMTIAANRNVGIGTTSPSQKLEVNGNIELSTSENAIQWQSGNGIIQAPSNLYIRTSGAGGNLLFQVNNDEKMRITSSGNVGIGTTSPTNKLHVKSGDNEGIFMEGTGGGHWFNFKSGTSNLWSMGAQSGFMGWYNRTNSSYKMVITDNGNVGIGTTSPQGKLDVFGSGRVGIFTSNNDSVPVSITSTLAGGISTLGFSAVGSANDYNVRIGASVHDFIAYTNNTERLRITSSGNVGIGTTSPTNKLHVAGRAYVNHQEMHLDSPSYAMLNLDASGANYSYVSLQKDDATIWDIAQYNGGNLEFRPYGSGTNSIYFTHSGQGYFEQLELKGYSHKYLYINPGNGREAMVRYNGGSGTTWYVGKRTSSDVVGTESFHFYSQAAGQTVAGIDTAGNGRFRGDVVAYYSDMRLKTKLGDIENAIEKVQALNGFYYEPNKIAQSYGYEVERRIGLSAQDVKEVVPEAIHDAPVGDGYMSVDYAKLVPVLVEAIKEQQEQIEDLKAQVERLIATR